LDSSTPTGLRRLVSGCDQPEPFLRGAFEKDRLRIEKVRAVMKVTEAAMAEAIGPFREGRVVRGKLIYPESFNFRPDSACDS